MYDLMSLRDGARLTLWHNEDFLSDTVLQGAVEERIEHAIGSTDLIVGLEILLKLDTAVLYQ